jgi:hypothetical protein
MRPWLAGSSGSNDLRQFSWASIQAVGILRASNEPDSHVKINIFKCDCSIWSVAPYRFTSDSRDEATAAEYRKAWDCW